MPSLLLILLLTIPGFAGATAQITDLIRLESNGEQKIIYVEPFRLYLHKNKDEIPKLKSFVQEDCSASWRGYQAHWEIKNKKLWITALFGDPCNTKPIPIPLATFFVDAVGPVHANWYSGDLVIPQGKMTKYVHMGYESQYEAYLILKIEKGYVVESKTIHPPSKDKP
jgi:hypothetical protein